jgi:hypothetical protein
VSKVYLHFTDIDGNPVIVPNDIVAIYTAADKTEYRSFHGHVVKTPSIDEVRVIRTQSGGQFEIVESTEEILKRIQEATAAEDAE